MSRKSPAAGVAAPSPAASVRASRDELRFELERRGLVGDLADRLACDLALHCGTLTPEARRGALTGMVLASAAHQESLDALRRSQRELADVERMMTGFAAELKKVDEAVKILSTFVRRIREQRTGEPGRITH